MRSYENMLHDTILVAAVWTGKSSPEWIRLYDIAVESRIPGLTDELDAIKRKCDELTALHSADPW